jgi:hypothetical protein
MEAIGSEGCIAPVAKSPLDSARGRGYRRRRYYLRSPSPAFICRVAADVATNTKTLQTTTIGYVK